MDTRKITSNYLNEICTDEDSIVYEDNINKFVILVSPSWKDFDGYFLKYFKVIFYDYEYSDKIFEVGSDNVRVYRIDLYKPEYIKDEVDYGYLSKEELQLVIDALSIKGSHNGYDDYLKMDNLTVWEKIIKLTNWEHSDDYKIHGIRWNKIPQDLPIPDYSLLPTRD